MSRRTKLTGTGVFLAVACCATGIALAQVAGSVNYTLEASVLDGAGGMAGSPTYALLAATAQPGITGAGSAPAYSAGHGFIPVMATLIESAEGEPSLAHPGDINEDFSMVLSEAIAYLSGWQQGSNPIAYAIRAAYLWQNGESYIYDSAEAPPLCWVLAP